MRKVLTLVVLLLTLLVPFSLATRQVYAYGGGYSFAELDAEKDSINQDIANLAADINSSSSGNGHYYNSYNLQRRAINLKNEAFNCFNRAGSYGDGNRRAVLLKRLFALEVLRADALQSGLQYADNGWNYLGEFAKGTKYSYQYDDEDAQYNSNYH
jgi:hypothetical protein